MTIGRYYTKWKFLEKQSALLDKTEKLFHLVLERTEEEIIYIVKSGLIGPPVNRPEVSWLSTYLSTKILLLSTISTLQM